MSSAKKVIQASAGAGGGPTGSYIAVAHAGSPYFTLLDHTSPGSVSLAAT